MGGKKGHEKEVEEVRDKGRSEGQRLAREGGKMEGRKRERI